MAGNIIHAIATTNAIIAGLITVVAMQILAGCLDLCKVRTCRLVTTCTWFCRLLSLANCSDWDPRWCMPPQPMCKRHGTVASPHRPYSSRRADILPFATAGRLSGKGATAGDHNEAGAAEPGMYGVRAHAAPAAHQHANNNPGAAH